MTKKERLFRMLCMTAGSGGGGGGGGDKPWEEMTWDEVIAATKNGKYKNFEIGAMKELDLGSEGIVHMQIVGIDVDDLADGSGKAPLTFISHELLKTSHRMNPALTPSSAPYNEGTGGIGGWEKSEMRNYLKSIIKTLIPENVRDAIKSVKKYSTSFDVAGTKTVNAVTTDDVWVPSWLETYNTRTFETSGPVYSEFFVDNDSRKKTRVETSAYESWALRTFASAAVSRNVNDYGTWSNKTANTDAGVALGFCL